MTHFSFQEASKRSLKFLFPFLLICIIHYTPYAQAYEDLKPLKGHQTQVYYSSGSEAKANRMAKQLDRVINFYKENIHFTPSVTLLVLSPQDWNNYAGSMVYGMPHYTNDKTLIVAAENNDFWKSFIPPLDQMPKELAQVITETYTDKTGNLTMESFFDLLAIHELGHAYHIQDSLVMQRNWMGELFVNIFLHSYIAENEPDLLPALTVFPKMVVSSTDKSTLKYTTLSDLDMYYAEIAQKYPRNYGWYQCRWHKAAANIYDEGKLSAFKKLWLTLKTQETKLDDVSFAALLAQQVHSSVANVLLKWDDADQQ
ncbi:MAG: hypothetical protein H6549_12560 [Chitinophagales bacterium]|nr:hypothetical protein [Chitinophagales bacterium]